MKTTLPKATYSSDHPDYRLEVSTSILDIDPAQWNGLLELQAESTPFMRHEYLAAMHDSGSATPKSGWTARFLVLRARNDRDHDGVGDMVAACAIYLKDHSYGEYVFDHSWANAYHQHGVAYYPKALVAPPFTPVPGARLLAKNAFARAALAQELIAWCAHAGLSSLHLLFASDADVSACAAAGMLLRHNVQFHWTSPQPAYADFEQFLASLSQDKRKKIRQERRKVEQAGVSFRWSLGADISASDWDFFYRCYERTYYEHGNAPYLSRDFFRRMCRSMPECWLLFVAERAGKPIATSLIGIHDPGAQSGKSRIAYGRYWGALERVDCLHFDACYYQPLEWCIAHGFQRFEGGAQGEHKMARALLPVPTTSAHWLAHPGFAEAVKNFLRREDAGMENYMEALQQRSPFKAAST